MLKEQERTTFRELRRDLLDDAEFTGYLRPVEPADPYSWARRFHAVVIVLAALVAGVMVLSGSYRSSVLFVAAGITLGIAYLIEGSEPPARQSTEREKEETDA